MLNRSWLPINVVDTRKAMRYLVSEDGRAVDPETFRIYDFDDWLGCRAEFHVRSEKLKVPVPEVIILECDALPMARSRGFSKSNIKQRDGGVCQYCGKKMPLGKLTVDHVVPKSRGGQTCYENLVTCCAACNRRKGNKTLSEADMTLMKKPNPPRNGKLIRLPTRTAKASWRRFFIGNSLES